MHRWLGAAGDNFYSPAAGPDCLGKTSSAPECGGETVNEGNYKYVGIAFYSLFKSTSAVVVTSAVPFYRYRSGNPIVHFYTASLAEVEPFVTDGTFIREGYYQTFPKDVPFTVPLHRWRSSTGQQHLYTISVGPSCLGKSASAAECAGERINEDGWVNEGIATYVFP